MHKNEFQLSRLFRLIKTYYWYNFLPNKKIKENDNLVWALEPTLICIEFRFQRSKVFFSFSGKILSRFQFSPNYRITTSVPRLLFVNLTLINLLHSNIEAFGFYRYIEQIHFTWVNSINHFIKISYCFSIRKSDIYVFNTNVGQSCKLL